MDRKEFIRKSLAHSAVLVLPWREPGAVDDRPFVMTVTGKVSSEKIGMALPHEHITTDFTGAEKVVQPQYPPADAVEIILPSLLKLKQQGVSLICECTPKYIGRDVRLLRLLSVKTGINIITNTGYYAAAGHKYLPQHAFHESSEQLSLRFLKEWTDGIEGTGIRPGFIKLGVDQGPLKVVDKKIIVAAAKTHLATGLKIAIHTGDSLAAREEFSILADAGVAPEAFIWVHAQNDTEGDTALSLAKKGCWISLDGINASPASIREYGNHLLRLKNNGLLNRVLISHDDGWSVNKDNSTGAINFDLFKNGNLLPYNAIFTHLKPALLKKGFTEADFSTLMVKNPVRAYSIKICRA